MMGRPIASRSATDLSTTRSKSIQALLRGREPEPSPGLLAPIRARALESRAALPCAAATLLQAAWRQNISRWIPNVVITLPAISSIEVWVVLSVGMRSARSMASAAATSRRQVSSWA